MSDNVLPLPSRIERLVRAIQNDLDRQSEGDREWIEATYDLCLHLAELRDQFAADIEFGHACEANGFGRSVLNHQDRSAAITMGRDPDALRACLEATKSRSLQLMLRNEFGRFTSVSKPTRRSTAKPRATTKKDTALEIARRLEAEGHEVTPPLLVQEAGVSYGTAQRAWHDLEREQRQAAMPLDPATASPSVRTRMESWQRSERKRLREVIRAELKAEYDFSGDAWVRQVWERSAWADKILESARGIMAKAEYQVIVKCLHPDTSPDPGLKAEAFRLFTQHKDLLLKPEVTFSGPPLPSLGELLARRRKS